MPVGVFLIKWCTKTQLTVGGTIPLAGESELYSRVETKENTNKQAREHACIHFSLLSIVDVRWPAVWSSCLDFPTMIDCNLEF